MAAASTAGCPTATSPAAGRRRGFRWALAPAALLPLFCSACTMTVHATVQDQSGAPLQNAVVYATTAEQRLLPLRSRREAVMVIEDLSFKPAVLPVQIGTGVSFLNRDEVKHHVYSISPAKRFELVADRGASAGPVTFDKPGIVVVGCAIHDRMMASLCVLETPYFARTDAQGRADLEGLPRGPCEVRVWHPDMKAAAAAARRLAEPSGGSASVDFRIPVRGSASPE